MKSTHSKKKYAYVTALLMSGNNHCLEWRIACPDLFSVACFSFSSKNLIRRENLIGRFFCYFGQI